MDIVSHDVKNFFGLLLTKNGYVLEQPYSPLIVHTTSEHAELKEICCPHSQPLSHSMGERGTGPSTSPLIPPPGRGGEGNQTAVITKHHSHHYFGFSETQWKLFEKERPRRACVPQESTHGYGRRQGEGKKMCPRGCALPLKVRLRIIASCPLTI
jgi:uncharacterized protein